MRTQSASERLQFSNLIPLFLFLFFYAGVFTGAIIRLISDIRAKHGRDSVKLYDCGKFTLAEDLSDISDMTRIDMSDINSLEGEPLEKFPGVFSCAPVRIL